MRHPVKSDAPSLAEINLAPGEKLLFVEILLELLSENLTRYVTRSPTKALSGKSTKEISAPCKATAPIVSPLCEAMAMIIRTNKVFRTGMHKD